MFKRMSIVTRRPGMTPEAFRKHWLEVHAPLVEKRNGLLRYTQWVVTGGLARDDVPAGPALPDGLTELWFDTLENATAASSERDAAIADCQNFLGSATTFVVEERAIVRKA